MPKKSNPIKNFFSTELHYKIISLLVAIAAWFGVMNTIAPLETKVYTAPIKFESVKELMAEGYIVSNIEEFDNQYIDIAVEATRNNLDELSKNDNKSAIYAKVDLSNIAIDDSETFPQSFIVNVQPTLPSYLNSRSYSVTGYSPGYISVEIDRIDTIELDLDVTTTGTVPDGYEIADTEVSQPSVTVSGPASRIDQAATAAVIVDVSNVTDDTTLSLTPSVYDKSSNALEGFVVEPDSVDVTLTVHKNNTVSINQPQTTGQLPPYLELSSIEWSPKSVDVVGDADNIANIESIDLNAVDLSQINADTVLTQNIENIIENAGLSLKNQANANVTITVKVKLVDPVTITLTSSDINVTGLPESKTITLPEKIEVQIAGVQNVDKTLLNPSVDVTGLSDGEHSVKLNLTVPPNAAINSDTNIDVTIQTNADTAEAAATETQTTETTVAEADDEDEQ